MPLLKNHPTTLPSIRPRKCFSISLAAITAAFCLAAVSARAGEPEPFKPNVAKTVDRSQSLIDSLRSRSASSRWIILQKERGLQDRPESTIVKPIVASQPKNLAPNELRDEKLPSFYKPFPLPEQLKADSLKSLPLAKEREDEQSSNLEFLEPIPISQSKTVPSKSQVADSPEQLKSVTDILPYHDYAPESFGKKTLGSKLPKEYWTTKKYEPRKFEEVLFTWEATNLYHNPLYFEDPALERYGHTYHSLVQPFASVGRFGVQLIGLPYQMTIDPIRQKDYTLGWYRPGECAPKLFYQIPWNARAAKVQAGVMTGLIFLIP